LTFFVDFLQNLSGMFENRGIEVQKSILDSVFSEKLVFGVSGAGIEPRCPEIYERHKQYLPTRKSW